ncbi:MAG: hypothetical protein NZT92_17065 [Abditibacteriales bacterium]|nr:hypothetical protein [Abditibacteriales bacterium]MDW8367584.1 hypothetical protein [Abditibacteriales bacterium]
MAGRAAGRLYYEAEAGEAYVLEVYMPYRLQYLPRFYDYLNAELKNLKRLPLFRGFSIYEVKGAFKGERGRVYDEPTMVVQLIYDITSYSEYRRVSDAPRQVRGRLDARLEELANQLIVITAFQELDYALPRRADSAAAQKKERIMRILCDAFNDGQRMIYRTSDDGRKIERVYEGDHPRAPIVPGRRICAFIEIGWESSEQGFVAEEAGLQRLLEIVRELREQMQNGSRNASQRRKAARQEGMVLVCDSFNDGHRMIYRTLDDGRTIDHVYEGDHPHDPPVLGRRLCAFAEVGWDNNEQGFTSAEAGLERLMEIVRELREETQNGARNATRRRKVTVRR